MKIHKNLLRCFFQNSLTHTHTRVCVCVYIVSVIVRNSFLYEHLSNLGNAVALLAESLRYKSESRGFDSQWCHWNFSLI